MRRAPASPRPAPPHLSITILGTSFSSMQEHCFALPAAARDLAVVDPGPSFGYLCEYIIECTIPQGEGALDGGTNAHEGEQNETNHALRRAGTGRVRDDSRSVRHRGPRRRRLRLRAH